MGLYRETRKSPRDQSSCWIPVAPGTPSDLSKSTEVRLTKSCLSSATYEIRTKPAKSRGLEKGGRRERILGLAGVPQCRGLRANARVYWGFLRAREPAENIWRGCDWRSETNRDPTLSRLWISRRAVRSLTSVARRAVQRHDPRQEPSAVVPLAGICAGGGEQSPSLVRCQVSGRVIVSVSTATPSRAKTGRVFASHSMIGI